jgi:hypothetical protein
MKTRTRLTHRQAVLHSGLTALLCAALVVAAALVPAPTHLIPAIVVVSIGVPAAVAWQMAHRRFAARHQRPLDEAEVEELLRRLDQLPEVHHPLGL